ncbi:MAG TPA: helix-turn-helix domain-containing protein [Thermotogota bacterium]|nr:helix-turn-helix domain-containing protein [Thermotogota bacterium]
MKLLTRDEVGEILRISRSTVIRYEKKGILKPVKLPDTRTILFDYEDIQKLIETSKEQTKSKDK